MHSSRLNKLKRRQQQLKVRVRGEGQAAAWEGPSTGPMATFSIVVIVAITGIPKSGTTKRALGARDAPPLGDPAPRTGRSGCASNEPSRRGAMRSGDGACGVRDGLHER